MILPIAFFYITNTVASRFEIHNQYLEIDYNPNGLGILSPKVLSLLENIEHPPVNSDGEKVDYKMTLDQNILNALAVQMG